MALTGKNIDLILGLKLTDFFSASRKAQVEYSKTKGKIEGKPINVKVNTGDVLKKIAGLGAAYLTVTRYIPEFVRLSDIQEKAENRLATALKNAGDATKTTYTEMAKFASWIQEVTTVGDEQAMMLQAMALNMGAPINRMKEVIKNAIALSKAFELDMNVAIRASVAALDDNYSMLTRYLPALRSAGSEAEKAATYQKSVSDGWKTATEELNTNAGAMEDFKNTIGDLKEDLGDFVKNVLVPLIKTIEPVISGFTNLDKSTQQTTVAMAALIILAPKLITAFRSMQLAFGPAGWLTLGLGAIAALWLENESAAQRAEKAFKTYIETANELDTDRIEKELKDLNDEIEQTIKLIAQETEEGMSIWESFIFGLGVASGQTELMITNMDRLTRKLEELEAKGRAYNQVLKERKDIDPGETIDREEKAAERTYQIAQINLDKIKRLEAGSVQSHKKSSEDKKKTEEKYYEFVADKAQVTSDLLSYAFIEQFQSGESAMASFLDSFTNMLASMAAQIASKSIIWGFFNLITGGGVGTLTKFLGFAEGGTIGGKQAGGLITEADIARAAFTPGGEDGLIFAQIGETVMNRVATQKFYPILEKMNEIGRGRYSFQEGGRVTSDTAIPYLSTVNINGFNEIIDAIRDIKIVIESDLDAIEFLRKYYPKYDKLEKQNRLLS